MAACLVARMDFHSVVSKVEKMVEMKVVQMECLLVVWMVAYLVVQMEC